MTKSFDLGPVLAALPAAIVDFKANEPLPAGAKPSLADIAAGLKSAKPDIDEIAALVIAHPGAIRALDRLAGVFEAQGATWAPGVRKFLMALPGGCASVENLLPGVIAGMSIFQAAPRGGPPITEGDWSGPHPVDNPSGAVPAGWTPDP